MPIAFFDRNTRGRDFVVGDIHACVSALFQALLDINFDPAVDRMFSVGDLVDRGREPELVLQLLDRSWFHAVQGNHEQMAIDWAAGQMNAREYNANGGGWNIGNPQAERQKYADAFSVLPIGIEIDTAVGPIGIVHADCPLSSWDDFKARLADPELSPLSRSTLIASAQWARDRADGKRSGSIDGVTALVVGHTPMKHVTNLDNVFYIDTGAGFGGRHLTVVQLAPNEHEVLRPVARIATPPIRLEGGAWYE